MNTLVTYNQKRRFNKQEHVIIVAKFYVKKEQMVLIRYNMKRYDSKRQIPLANPQCYEGNLPATEATEVTFILLRGRFLAQYTHNSKSRKR